MPINYTIVTYDTDVDPRSVLGNEPEKCRVLQQVYSSRDLSANG